MTLEVELYRDILPFGLDVKTVIDTIPWEQNFINMYGKQVREPRLTALYGDMEYRYSGTLRQPLPWTLLLQGYLCIVQKYCSVDFNSCLLNYYRDGKDSIGFHADNEKELGCLPIIATLSLGSSRTLIMRKNDGSEERNFDLYHGDLLVMFGNTQKNWKHGIEKVKNKNIGPRVSLTFRKILA